MFFKVEDLETIVKHMKNNDIKEFDMAQQNDSITGPLGPSPATLKFVCENGTYTVTRDMASAGRSLYQTPKLTSDSDI